MYTLASVQLQEHAELRRSHQATVAALMSDRSALEAECVSQYLEACAEFQAELQGLGEALAEEHTKLRRRSVPRACPRMVIYTPSPLTC